jgi:hypothetical protein
MKTNLYIQVGDEEQVFLVDKLLGGQRLLLSEEAASLLIGTLMAGEEICLKAGRYELKVASERFPVLFNSVR